MSGVTDAARALVDRVQELASEQDRVIIGIAGAPGSGKSTVASWLAAAVTAEGLPAAWVPMDGFHLADAALDRLGRRHRKGAIDTFDGHGYVALLRRLHDEREGTVYAPAFERDLEQPIANSIPVPPETRVVVTEGNYLLADEEPWPLVRRELTEVWYVETEDALRRDRLVARHIRFGKDPASATAWVDQVDEPNAELIAACANRADLLVDLEELALPMPVA